MMNNIVVVGSLNIDFVITTAKIPAKGETVTGRSFAAIPGGKGGNQAVAAAKLGGNVTMVGCVGDDPFGHELIGSLRNSGVETKHIRVAESVNTGTAIVIVHEGDNSIILHRGANAHVDVPMVQAAEPVFRQGGILLLQLEIELETVKAAMRAAAHHGLKVVLNPAPAVRLDDDVLSNVDVLVLNETECMAMTGLPLNDVADAEQAIDVLRSKGIEQIVVTLGANGAVFNDGARVRHVPVYQVKVADTTAAGDTFIGALAVSLARGEDIGKAVTFANAAGALAVTKLGAQPSIPAEPEVLAFLSERSDSRKEGGGSLDAD